MLTYEQEKLVICDGKLINTNFSHLQTKDNSISWLLQPLDNPFDIYEYPLLTQKVALSISSSLQSHVCRQPIVLPGEMFALTSVRWLPIPHSGCVEEYKWGFVRFYSSFRIQHEKSIFGRYSTCFLGFPEWGFVVTLRTYCTIMHTVESNSCIVQFQ